ncbi:hypothetical protein ACIRBY_37265 [Streptomyces sp. NPDC096136]|uniref:hypothetical protein n=1 Tax=Streptomyces sp. NPDC096136 TaxID=3366076 RepID=UPI0038277641
MQRNSRAIAPEAVAALDLTDLMWSGAITSMTATADGSWIVVPTIGKPVILTTAADVAAYIDHATTGTGPQALAPARTTPADEDGCGCAPQADTTTPTDYGPDLMQARAILAELARQFDIPTQAMSAAYDEAAQAAVVRVQTRHGLYALHIPAISRQFVVSRNRQRDGVISARRVPATSDTTVTLLFGAYLRDRGAL